MYVYRTRRRQMCMIVYIGNIKNIINNKLSNRIRIRYEKKINTHVFHLVNYNIIITIKLKDHNTATVPILYVLLIAKYLLNDKDNRTIIFEYA